MKQPRAHTIRRSVALPPGLVEEVRSLAPPELRDNLNRLVVASLQEFVSRRRAEAFDAAMARMASDPAIRAECSAMAAEFAPADMDGITEPPRLLNLPSRDRRERS